MSTLAQAYCAALTTEEVAEGWTAVLGRAAIEANLDCAIQGVMNGSFDREAFARSGFGVVRGAVQPSLLAALKDAVQRV